MNAPAQKPGCTVRGLIAPGVMCGSVIVGSQSCGFNGSCEHQVPAAEPAQSGLVDCGQCRTQGCPAGKCREAEPRVRWTWDSQRSSSSSMVKVGTYPEGMTREEVEKHVIGSWGGAFESFGNGHFVYRAYTD